MSKQTINGHDIFYFTKDELAQVSREDAGCGNLYKYTFKVAESISNQLKIQFPDIGFKEQIVFPDDTGGVNVLGAWLYSHVDVPSLKNNLIIMSLEDFEEKQFTGTLAHEMRHIWQYTYHPEMNAKPAKGFEESLIHPAEIDADGYAIWYISENPDMSIEKAAGIMCPAEKENHPKEYMCRIEKAKEIKEYYDEQSARKNAGREQKGKSFLNSIMHFFKK